MGIVLLALAGATVARGDAPQAQRISLALAASSPTLTVKPTSGAPGTSVSTSGTHFGPSEQIVVHWDPPLDAEQVLPSNPPIIQTDATGAFTATVTIPLTATSGLHTLTAVGQTSSLSASANFVVISVPSPMSQAPRFFGTEPVTGVAYLTYWERKIYITLVMRLSQPVAEYSAVLRPGRCGSNSAAVQPFGAIVQANDHGLGITTAVLSSPVQRNRVQRNRWQIDV
jgi:hypothetical protein